MSRGGQRGFTLVELLVALTLLGMISVMIVGGLSFGSRTWERTRESSTGLNAVVATHQFLRARLSETSGSFVGSAQEVVFESVWMSSLGAGALYEFRLSLSPESELLLEWRPAREEEPPEELVGARALLTGVEALAIGYYGAVEPSAEPAWSDSWEIEDRRPALVSIDLRLAEAPDGWPPLVVALAD